MKIIKQKSTGFFLTGQDGIIPTDEELLSRARQEFPQIQTEDMEVLIVGESEFQDIINKPRSLEEAKQKKIQELLTETSRVSTSITEGYSDIEQKSWPKQEAEARELLTNSSASAPVLRGIAQIRGITIEEMRDKVLTNVNLAEQATAKILGWQQKQEDLVKVCQTIEEVQNISSTYTE